MKRELEQDTLDFIRRYLHVYFEHRDLETLRGLVDEQVDWIGIGPGEMSHTCGKDQLAPFVVPGSFEIVQLDITTSAVDQRVCLAGGTMLIRQLESDTDIQLRLSAVCRRSETGDILLREGHMSLPLDNETMDKAISGLTRQRERFVNDLLGQQERRVAQRDRDLAALTNNLPGAVVCCDDTTDLNLIEFSDGFLKLYGYNRQEVRELFHNRFSEMILAEDLAKAWDVVKAQLAKGSTKEIEYRVRRKDGSLIWVLDRGQHVLRGDGTGYFYCILIDETETRQAREALKASLERHEIIMAQTNDIIFEWDLDTDEVELAANWEKKFGYAARPGSTAAEMERSGYVHPEDKAELTALYRRIRGNEPYGEAEVRVADSTGRYIWCRLRVTLQHTVGDRRAVGVVIDIDGEKRQAQKLRQMAERDALTGLYNKGATRSRIDQVLTGSGIGEPCALMILDLDDFKRINDRHGHLCGDAVLSDVAGALLGLFRKEDIIGRIGGDEFCVFLRGLWSEEALRQKAEAVLELFRGVLQQGRQWAVSASLGIAIAPRDGVDYPGLFQNADVALYHAKEKGKNQYTIYDASMGWPELRSELAASRGSERDHIDSEENSRYLGSELAQYVFRVLYQAPDAEAAIPLLLEIIGRQMDVSRTYIYEVEENGRFITNTFEWHSEDVESEQKGFQHIAMADIEDILSSMEEKGSFFCKDITRLKPAYRALLSSQGIYSTLQCGIYDGGRFCGAVGFDECRGVRLWTQEQVSALTLVADIVGTFLMKWRIQARSDDLVQSLKHLLDHQKDCIYVVDAETYEVLYANQKTLDVVPGLKLGDRCHEAYYRRSKVCAECPTLHRNAEGVGQGMVYSWLLDQHLEVHVDTITWVAGRPAYLLCSHSVEQEDPK